MVTIERLRAILGSDRLVLEEIKGELAELRERYGDKRRTEIIPETHDISIEDMIADEPMVITVSQSGYVKRSPLSLYRAQARGGKGRTGMVTKEDDFVEHLYVATAHSYILVFTESGRVHWLKVHEIPEAGPTARGKAIVNLLNLEPTERLATTVAVREFRDDRYPRLRHRERHGEEDGAVGLRQSAGGRHHRHQHRRGGPPAGGARDGRQEGHPVRHREGVLDPLPGERRPLDGPGDLRRQGARAAPGRPGGRHGGARSARPGAHRHRARLRQADAGRELPPPGARRPRHHQPQGDAEDGRGGGGPRT